MSKYFSIFLLAISLLTCQAQETSIGGWVSIADYQGDRVLKVRLTDSLSTTGFYYPSRRDSVQIVLTSWRGDMSIDSVLTQYKMIGSKISTQEKGVMLVLTDSTRNNSFQLLNYPEPDSSFYVHRLAIGGISRNININNSSFTLARLYFYDRR